MISVEEALARVVTHYKKKGKEKKSVVLEEALHTVLAQAIYAPIALPPFKQSAMDGYAVHCHHQNTYQIVGEIQAGDSFDLILKPGEACRIFTGAGVPETANAVVMQEHVNLKEGYITLLKKPVVGQNIRTIGEQISQGSLVFEPGTFLNPPALGLIQSLGISSVEVYTKPRVSILITGNELELLGNPLTPGKIYESNSLVLQSALNQMGITTIEIGKVKDDLGATRKALECALAQADLVLISGGISVGDFDFVGQALKEIGVEEIFYKVKQKPGKPLFFGKHEQTYLFALPGNPASTLNCFYVYVYPFLEALMGKTSRGLLRLQQPLAQAFENSSGRALFLKAVVKNNKVTVLSGQASSMIKAFAAANALVYIPSEKKKITQNEWVETLLLPHGI